MTVTAAPPVGLAVERLAACRRSLRLSLDVASFWRRPLETASDPDAAPLGLE